MSVVVSNCSAYTDMPYPQLIYVQDDHEERLKARYATLSQLPIPKDMPNDTLLPIVIPPPFTIYDFIGTVTGVRAQM